MNRPSDLGGDPACWLDRVCPECNTMSVEDDAERCERCGAALPEAPGEARPEA